MGIVDCQETYDERTGHLVRNLTVAAGLCLSDDLAYRRGINHGLDIAYGSDIPTPDPYFEPGRPHGACVDNPFSSRACELGTKGCDVDHVCDPETGRLMSHRDLIEKSRHRP